jgi:hypothetical protein
MSTTVAATDRNTEAFARIHTQSSLALIGEVPGLQVLPGHVIQRATFNGVLSEAARHSGMDDQTLAERINISQGYMSRFMRGLCAAWAKRLIAFMRVTQSLAPLQWIADQMGCDLTVRSAAAAEKAQLLARLRELERGGAAA